MHAHVAHPPRWTTASFADATDSAPMELRELGAHVSRCNGCRGRWFALHCAADALHDFVAPRFVTTLCIVSAVLGLAALAL
ncbi:MAG: hypothetical protein ACSLE9_18825 [Burkholderiaceae bacterium]|jgi:hypothetical protein